MHAYGVTPAGIDPTTLGEGRALPTEPYRRTAKPWTRGASPSSHPSLEHLGWEWPSQIDPEILTSGQLFTSHHNSNPYNGGDTQ